MSSYAREIVIEKKKSHSDEEKKKSSELVEAMRQEESRIVKGIFKNSECPGGDLMFPYRAYKGEPIRMYHFEDGKEYDIPLGVARHINRECKVKKHSWLVDKNGKKIIGAGKPKERYSFISTDFI